MDIRCLVEYSNPKALERHIENTPVYMPVSHPKFKEPD
jgi:hypothetical protein